MSAFRGTAATLACSCALLACDAIPPEVPAESTPEALVADRDALAARRGFRHVLLISIDTLRADYLGCYGHPIVETPHIDGLAAAGIRFANHIAAAPTTLASHTSLMTGTYPHTHGVARNSFRVPDESVMLAERLRARGFDTAAFLGAAVLQSSVNFTQGFDFVDEDFSAHPGSRRDEPAERAHRRASDVTDAVIRWLDDSAPAKPLFLFVHYFDVHWGYRPPPPFNQLYRTDSVNMTGSLSVIKRIRSQLAEKHPEALKNAERLAQLYAGEVTYTDSQIGRLLAALDARGLLDEMLVVVTADHGETMWEHDDWFNHGLDVFDTTTRIPLIIRFPDERRAGSVIERTISNIDVAPTLLDWLDLELPIEMEGRSFAAVADSDELAAHPPAFSEATHPFRPPYEDDPSWLNQNKRQSIRTSKSKLIYDPVTQGYEFYDLESDPREQNPLPPTSAVALRLQAELLAWRAGAAPRYTCTTDSDESLEQLRVLGYLDAAEPPKCNRIPSDDAP